MCFVGYYRFKGIPLPMVDSVMFKVNIASCGDIADWDKK